MSTFIGMRSEVSLVQWMSDGASDHPGPDAVRGFVVAAKAGDVAAFGYIVELHESRVFRTARAILGSDSDAEDAVQEVFVRAYRYLARFDESRELAPWLYRITANVCRDLAKNRRRHHGVSIESLHLASSQSGPFESLARQEQRELIREAIARLPYKEGAAITLRDLEGLTTREVAKALGTTEATVRSQISSARAKLRKYILRIERRTS